MFATILAVIFIGLIVYANFRWIKSILSNYESYTQENIQKAVETKIFTLDEAESEERVRLNWLYAFFWNILSYYAISIIEPVVSLLFGPDYIQPLNFSKMYLLPIMLFFSIFYVFVNLSISFYISYYCGYKKRGTKWLLFEIIVCAINLGLFFCCFGISLYACYQGVKIHIVFALAYLFTIITWYKLVVETIKLRKYNLIRKKFVLITDRRPDIT